MSRPSPTVVIDARPRGPSGPLAVERVLGRPVLRHLLELASMVDAGPIDIHARLDEHEALRTLLVDQPGTAFQFATGPTPEGAAVLRADRLYDRDRLRRALRRGRDPESAVLWRLDPPLGLAGADDELIRRQTYQPIGRFWALGPARALAQALCPTRVRPNAVTLASAALVLGTSAAIATVGDGWTSRLGCALALALALVLDTTDGHLARLQGTASEFGRWLDGYLDEVGDMALHAAIAWSAFARDGQPGWLLLGMAYAIGKYLFVVARDDDVGEDKGERTKAKEETPVLSGHSPFRLGPVAFALVRGAGHADVRWHLWIILAMVGRLDMALAAYALYFPARALAVAVPKGGALA